MKESKYVRLANTLFRVLKYARIPLFLHQKSNHVFTAWQHTRSITSIKTIWKEKLSYVCRLVGWSLLSKNFYGPITHTILYTTLQKFASRITKTVLEKIIYSFILLHSNIIRWLFIGIDSSGFKVTNASQYYIDKANLRKKYLKLSVSADIYYFN